MSVGEARPVVVGERGGHVMVELVAGREGVGGRRLVLGRPVVRHGRRALVGRVDAISRTDLGKCHLTIHLMFNNNNISSRMPMLFIC